VVRRRCDAPALAATVLALMSKESGSVAFVLVGSLALAREVAARTPARLIVRRLAADLWPFLVLGLAYVALRFALFGNATQAYVGVAVDMTSAEHWARLMESALAWGRVNFPGRPACGRLRHWRRQRSWLRARCPPIGRARRAPISSRCSPPSPSRCCSCCASFPSSTRPASGPTLLLPGALLALALGLAMGRIVEPAASGFRRRMAAQVIAGLLLAATPALDVARGGRLSHRASRDEGRRRGGGADRGRLAQPSGAPAGSRYAGQGGVRPQRPGGVDAAARAGRPLSDRVLVQTDKEIPEIPAKIARGLFDWLPRHSIFRYPAGTDALPGTGPTQPSSELCWSSREHRSSASSPGRPIGVGETTLEGAYAAAECG
jgi:hypothetical protein